MPEQLLGCTVNNGEARSAVSQQGASRSFPAVGFVADAPGDD